MKNVTLFSCKEIRDDSLLQNVFHENKVKTEEKNRCKNFGSYPRDKSGCFAAYIQCRNSKEDNIQDTRVVEY